MTDQELSAANGVLEHEISSTIERLEDGKRGSGVCPEHSTMVDGQILAIRIGEQTLKQLSHIATKVEMNTSNRWGKIGWGKFQASGQAVVVFGVVTVVGLFLYFKASSAQQLAADSQKVVREIQTIARHNERTLEPIARKEDDERN